MTAAFQASGYFTDLGRGADASAPCFGQIVEMDDSHLVGSVAGRGDGCSFASVTAVPAPACRRLVMVDGGFLSQEYQVAPPVIAQLLAEPNARLERGE